MKKVVLIIIAIALFLIGAWLVVNNTTAPNANTYRNAAYGFSIQYPLELKPVNPAYPEQLLDALTADREDATKAPIGELLVSVYSRKSGGIPAGKCEAIPKSDIFSTVSDATTTTIDGVDFISFTSCTKETKIPSCNKMFQSLRNDTCYIISTIVYSSETAADLDMRATLESAARTFAFTK